MASDTNVGNTDTEVVADMDTDLETADPDSVAEARDLLLRILILIIWRIWWLLWGRISFKWVG